MKHIIFDLDGTLSLIGHRLHLRELDYDAFCAACVDDVPNWPVIQAFQIAVAANIPVWIVTGRSANVRAQTLTWLKDHMCVPDELIMRPAGNKMHDHELKQLWLNNGVLPSAEDILFVYEDRQRVVDMWRRNGLTCFQVAPGAF